MGGCLIQGLCFDPPEECSTRITNILKEKTSLIKTLSGSFSLDWNTIPRDENVQAELQTPRNQLRYRPGTGEPINCYWYVDQAATTITFNTIVAPGYYC